MNSFTSYLTKQFRDEESTRT